MPIRYNKGQRAATAFIVGAVAVGAGLAVTVLGAVVVVVLLELVEQAYPVYGTAGILLLVARTLLMLLCAFLGGFVTARMEKSWLLCALLGGIEGIFLLAVFLSANAGGLSLLLPLFFFVCALLGYVPVWRKRRRIEREKREGEQALLSAE